MRDVWEAVVLIPLIDEKRLLAAMLTFSRRLTKDEQLRNACWQTLSFKYDHSKDYEYPRVTQFNCMEHCIAWKLPLYSTDMISGLFPKRL